MSASDELLVEGYPNSLRPELHKALKARGIDYWVVQGITFWNRDDGCECLAYGYKVNGVPELAVKVVGLTDPEQAIAATLGDDDPYRHVSELEAENAKLRELVCHMHECMSNVDADGNHECFVCEYENADCEFDSRIRDLGVEVGK